ncbi:MAG TPA: hypothetical protein VMR34_05685 [Candidatus Saccharimonadales bacterium]|nr:hypothetical protein [Candidatus Saccharimonadales bacterium]
MEKQTQESIDPQLTPKPNPNLTQNPYVSLPPKPNLTEAEAEALLTINRLQPTKPTKHSKKFPIAIAVLLLIVIATSLYAKSGHSTKKTSGSSSPSVSLPNANNPVNDNGSINQQVQYCSNIINGNSVC